ncbi:hypothetical protein [Paraburkholderia graminis]|uniref:Chromosome segregation ATPase n=1 Tax=Paraburkholderia graminis TaxID=60548 RepID=A0ABD5CBF9_9BURK|nr:hypothetical protein [Paraburkholderia graminis]MDR6201885.1 chromosome segregation ATPase [Paraburkholderia graminis]
MINEARITVDDATRQVLDQLDEHLSQVPPWARQLKQDVLDEVGDATRDALAAPARSLARLGETVTSLQKQGAAQIAGLASLSTSLKAVEVHHGKQQSDYEALARQSADLLASNDALGAAAVRQEQAIATLQKHTSAAGEDAVGLRAMAGEQGQRIQTVLAQLLVLVDSAQHQNGQIAEIRDEQARLRSAHEQTSASVQRHGDAVRALGEELELAHRQQDERISRALEALQIIGDQLREQRTVLAQQNDALQSVTQRVERISRPWWKKLF